MNQEREWLHVVVHFAFLHSVRSRDDVRRSTTRRELDGVFANRKMRPVGRNATSCLDRPRIAEEICVARCDAKISHSIFSFAFFTPPDIPSRSVCILSPPSNLSSAHVMFSLLFVVLFSSSISEF